MPSILELQRMALERLAELEGARMVESCTSCGMQSCNGHEAFEQFRAVRDMGMGQPSARAPRAPAEPKKEQNP